MTVKDIIIQSCRLDKDRDYNIEIIDRELWVFFHASWSWLDWVRDFLCWPKKYRNGTYHYGYVKEFLDIENYLLIDLLGLVGSFDKITFTGYSRGASVALLAYLTFKNTAPSRVVLIGMPRTEYGELAQIKGEIIQYGKDLVTDLPPWMKKRKPNFIIKSENTGWFKSIKDHEGYFNCEITV